MSKTNTKQARSYARKRAVQLLYQWQLNPTPVNELIKEFVATQEMERVDMEYFDMLVHKTIASIDDLDSKIAPYTDLPLDQLDPIEQAILRLSIYELCHVIQTPYRVILNEAINLAKTYGGEQGHAFINAVLDKAVKTYRELELRAEQN